MPLLPTMRLCNSCNGIFWLFVCQFSVIFLTTYEAREKNLIGFDNFFWMTVGYTRFSFLLHSLGALLWPSISKISSGIDVFRVIPGTTQAEKFTLFIYLGLWTFCRRKNSWCEHVVWSSCKKYKMQFWSSNTISSSNLIVHDMAWACHCVNALLHH